MADFFEITFILNKEKAEKENSENKLQKVLDLCYLGNKIKKHKYQLFRNQKVFFEIFPFDDEDEELYYNDFLELRISFTGMIVTPINLKEKIKLLACVIGDCLKVSEAIVFAICMYEGAYHYFDKINRLNEFDEKLLLKFPLLFFRSSTKNNFTPYVCFDEFYCVFNKYNFQDIFVDPVSIAKEDYKMDLNYEEAVKLIKNKYKKDFKYFNYE